MHSLVKLLCFKDEEFDGGKLSKKKWNEKKIKRYLMLTNNQ
jgi:hypothetical protein